MHLKEELKSQELGPSNSRASLANGKERPFEDIQCRIMIHLLAVRLL